MRKKVLAIVFATALLLGGAVPLIGGGTAFATAPVDPSLNGQANCLGQNMAASAKDHGGQKKAIAAHGTASIKVHVRAIHDSYCPSSPGPTG